MSRRQADLRGGGAAALPDGPRADDARRPADAEALRHPAGPAERLRDRPQPRALRGRSDRRDPQAPLRGRAARRARPRAGARPQPRHPDPPRSRDDRRRDHLPRLHADVVRRRQTTRRSAWSAPLALVILAPARGRDHPAGDLAPARVLRRRDRRRDLRQPGVAGERAAAPRGGRAGDPDAGQPGRRAALHRQAVLAVAASRPSSRRIRRSRSASAGSARCARRSRS